jgi:hypothetical protein
VSIPIIWVVTLSTIRTTILQFIVVLVFRFDGTFMDATTARWNSEDEKSTRVFIGPQKGGVVAITITSDRS